MPQMWQRILDYMRQRNQPVRPIEVQKALGLATTSRHMMNRMVQAGLLRRVETGVYVVASPT
jgi:DNA-binding IclR family transcriptional regulator